MMRKTDFVEVTHCVHRRSPRSERSEEHFDRAYLRAGEIKDICELTGKHRLIRTITKEEYDNRKPGTDDDYIVIDSDPTIYQKYLVSTQVVMAFGAPGHNYLIIEEEAENFLARVNAVEFPPQPEGPRLNHRGVWLPGETYLKWDMVQHPDNVANELLCLKTITSTSKLALTNVTYWCKLPPA